MQRAHLQESLTLPTRQPFLSQRALGTNIALRSMSQARVVITRERPLSVNGSMERRSLPITPSRPRNPQTASSNYTKRSTATASFSISTASPSQQTRSSLVFRNRLHQHHL